jgi:hypothetical protein
MFTWRRSLRREARGLLVNIERWMAEAEQQMRSPLAQNPKNLLAQKVDRCKPLWQKLRRYIGLHEDKGITNFEFNNALSLIRKDYLDII